MILVMSAEGAPAYAKQFDAWADSWRLAAKRAGANLLVIRTGTSRNVSAREQLKRSLEAEPKQGSEEFWLVLAGHGTYDGRTARFNLHGPDISAAELATWLEPFRRPVVVINCAPCSGPFINRLSAPGRVVITATRSGNEQNFTRFGEKFAEAIADPEADYDKDRQTSLLEAFLAASRRVADFYRTEARLETEHALIDDNGDGLGTPAAWFRGIRAMKKAKDGTTHDGNLAHQLVLIRSRDELSIPPELRARRNHLELAVAQLRERKDTLPEADYYQQLEVILLELAELNEGIERQVK